MPLFSDQITSSSGGRRRFLPSATRSPPEEKLRSPPEEKLLSFVMIFDVRLGSAVHGAEAVPVRGTSCCRTSLTDFSLIVFFDAHFGKII